MVKKSSDTPQKTKTATPALPFTVKADLKEYRKRLGTGRIVLAVIISLLLWLRYGFLVWLISVAVIALIIVIGIGMQARRKVTVTAEGLTYTGPLGTTKTITYADIKDAIIFVQYVDWSFGAMPRLFIVKQDGSSFVSLTGLFWSIEELDKLISGLQAKNIDVQFSTAPATSRLIASQFPKILPSYERHPWIIVLVTLVVIVAIIGLLAVLAALNG